RKSRNAITCGVSSTTWAAASPVTILQKTQVVMATIIAATGAIGRPDRGQRDGGTHLDARRKRFPSTLRPHQHPPTTDSARPTPHANPTIRHDRGGIHPWPAPAGARS